MHYVLPTSSVWLLLWSFCCRIPVLRLWGPISNLSGLIGSSTCVARMSEADFKLCYTLSFDSFNKLLEQ